MSPSRPRRRLTIVRLMKLVALCAAAMAVVGPIARMAGSDSLDPIPAAIMAGVSAPLAMACAALLIVRPGGAKDRLIAALLLVPVVLFFGVFAAIVVMAARGLRGAPVADPEAVTVLVIALLVVAAMGAFLVALARKLVPERCPSCGRLAMYRDPLTSRRTGRPVMVSEHCLACGRDGCRLVPVDATASPPSNSSRSPRS